MASFSKTINSDLEPEILFIDLNTDYGDNQLDTKTWILITNSKLNLLLFIEWNNFDIDWFSL